MQKLFEQIALIGVQWGSRYLVLLLPEHRQEAGQIIAYEIANMIMESIEAGHYTGVPAEFRAKYEERVLDALRALGLVAEG